MNGRQEIKDYIVVPTNRVVEYAERGYELYGSPYYDSAERVAMQALVKYILLWRNGAPSGE